MREYSIARARRGGNIPLREYSTRARIIFRHIVSVAMPRDRSKSNQLFFNIFLYVPTGLKTRNGAPYIRAAIRVPGRDAALGEYLKRQKTPFDITILSQEHMPPGGLLPPSRFPYGETDLHFEDAGRLNGPEEEVRDGNDPSGSTTTAAAATTASRTHAAADIEIARCLETLSRLCTRGSVLGKRQREFKLPSTPRPTKLHRVVSLPDKESGHSATDTDIDVM